MSCREPPPGRSQSVALALCALSATWCPTALADGTRGAAPASSPAPSGPAPSAVSSAPRGEWGWLLVFPSLAAGGGLLAYGLSIECAEQDTGCQRGAGAALWGGVGLASLGSLLGLAVVQAGRALPAPASPAPQGDGGATLRLALAPAGGAPLRGLVLQLQGELP